MRTLVVILVLASCRGPGVYALKDAGQPDAGTPDCTTDVVALIDMSGSMAGKLGWVREQLYGLNNDYWLALVGVPDADSNKIGTVHLITDFKHPQDMRKIFYSAKFDATGIDREATLDGLDLVLQEDNPLGLSWTTKARNVLLFTDEKPQSFATPFVKPEWLEHTARVQAFVSSEVYDAWFDALKDFEAPLLLGTPVEVTPCKH